MQRVGDDGRLDALLDPTGTRNLADTKTRTADASLHGGDGIETGQAASNYFANSSSRGV